MPGRLCWQGIRDVRRQPWSCLATVAAVAVTVYLGGIFALASCLDTEFLSAPRPHFSSRSTGGWGRSRTRRPAMGLDGALPTSPTCAPSPRARPWKSCASP
jgi:hypothetical protein